MLGLHLLNQEPQYTAWATEYARSTMRWGSFVRFSSALNDLYVFLHVLEGHSREHLKDRTGSASFFRSIHVDLRSFQNHLRLFAFGSSSGSANKRFLLQLENQLHVSNGNYRSCRRAIDDWNQIDVRDQQVAVQRLIQAFRAHAPRSDILSQLESLAAAKNHLRRNQHNQALDTIDKQELIRRALVLQAQLGVELPIAAAMARKEMTK